MAKAAQDAETQMTAKQKREAREQSIIDKARQEGRADALNELNKNSTIHPDQVSSAAGDVAKPQSAGGKVIVGCKLDIAYYDIQLCKKEKVFEQNMQGGRDVDAFQRVGEVVRLRGTAYPRGTPPTGFPERPLIASGAALNFNIDRNFMVEWLAQNHLNPIVKNKMIFIHDNQDGIVGMAKDFVEITSGLAPIDPRGDSRIPKSTRAEVEDVKPGVKTSA